MTETKNNQQNAFTTLTCFTKTDSRQQQLLNKACSMLPEEVIDFFLKNPILFSGEIEENKAEIMRFSKEYKKHRFIVHLHSRLWSMTDDEIMYCILTQIAHCYLGNEPGFWSWKQNQGHSSKQEDGAQQLVNQWISHRIEKLFGIKKSLIFLNRNLPPPDTHLKDIYS